MRDQWKVQCQPHVRIRLKQVFGSVATGAGRSGHAIALSNTDEICRDLVWFMTRYPLEISKSDLKVLRAGARRHERVREKILRILEGDFQLPAVDMALPLRPYQEQAAAAVLNLGYLLVVDELGLGKSAISIRVMADERALPALAVVDSSLTHQWKTEIQKFAPALRVHVVRSREPYDVAEKDGIDPHVLVISYAKLWSWADQLAGKIRFVVFDEAQELRTGTESKKNRAAAQIAAQARFTCGLTATPIYNYGGEMFNVLDVLAPGRLGTQDEFLREWCGSVLDKRKASIGDPEAFGTYVRDIGLMIRRTRDDVGRQLPAISRVVHEVQPSYDADFWETTSAAAELARVVLDATAPNIDRLQASGMLDTVLRQATGVQKAPHVAAFVRMLLEQDTDKVVLFGWHRAVYDIWADLLEDFDPAWYTGHESPAKKRKEVERFVEGDSRLLIMSLRAGRGLNRLQEVCATTVHGELDWSPAVHAQCDGRIHRDGQKRPVFAYYVVGNTGSDPVVSDVLGLKTAQLEGIRDPGGSPLTIRDVNPQHVKKLAEDYLRRFGGKP